MMSFQTTITAVILNYRRRLAAHNVMNMNDTPVPIGQIYYVPPTEGGGHIVFGAVPVGVGVGVGVRVGVRVGVASFLRDIF